VASAAAFALPMKLKIPGGGRHRHHATFHSKCGPLQPFADPLPIMPRLPLSGAYEIRMREARQVLHSAMRPTRIWGYDGIYPGPQFEVRSGFPVSVKWENKLPQKHFLPIDHTIHGAGGVPDVRSVVHVHGADVLPESDGYPDAWFTRDFKEVGPDFASRVYQYPNERGARTLFYHDHALGITRLNIYAGLAGFYIVRDDQEDSLGLPSVKYEISLMIQDRSFHADGSLAYPDQGVTSLHPVWVPEFFGDTAVVNGRVMPYLNVEPRKYRFRILNMSNARFYNLRLSTGNPFVQIGADQGLLPKPVMVSNLLLAPTERADVIVDFSDMKQKAITMTNDAAAPFPDPDPEMPLIPNIMQFRVVLPLKERDRPLPNSLASVPLLAETAAARVRDITIEEDEDPMTEEPVMATLERRMWDDPVVEDPKAGSTEIWRLINTTDDAHPIHVHLVRFQVVDRQRFNVDQFKASGQLVLTGPVMEPPVNEKPAWKDSVRADPGVVTRIIARFDLPKTAVVVPGKRFRYVFHCHILEHEENEMMRPYDVVG
jgi:spore coat protein A